MSKEDLMNAFKAGERAGYRDAAFTWFAAGIVVGFLIAWAVL